ncbi:DNA repair and recombination protein RadB [Nanoarchaeota archaeon]
MDLTTQTKASSGTEVLDKLLEGGFENDVITTIYGPAGTGKTNFCIAASIQAAKNGKKVIYIDSEGGFSVERFKQMINGSGEKEEIINNIIFYKPTTFEEQRETFEKLKEAVNENTGLIVFDSVAMLYRLEVGKTDDIVSVNRELGQQIASLTEITRKNNIPILLTNQVYSDFENPDNVKLVGGDILKYGSKSLIELKNLHSNKRGAILKKHRSLPKKEIAFEIKEEGLFEIE